MIAPKEYVQTWNYLTYLNKTIGDNNGTFDDAGMTTPPADLDFLTELARSLPPNPIVIEVGSWAGRTAINFARARDDIKVFCVDTWEGSASDVTGDYVRKYSANAIFGVFLRNTKDYLYNKIFPCRGPSDLWAKMWPLDNADMVYLDGNHEYMSVREDIKMWKPRVQTGGIIAGHDYVDMFPGVIRAVHEMFPDGIAVSGHCVWHRRI